MSNAVGFLNINEEMRIEWRVPNFFSLSDAEDASYLSPSFKFMGQDWYLSLRTNAQSTYNTIITKGCISVYLHITNATSPVTVVCSFAIKTKDGEKYQEKSFAQKFEKSESFGLPAVLRRSELITQKIKLVPSDVLTIVCTVGKHGPSLPSRTDELSRDMRSLWTAKTHADVTVRVEGEDFRLHRSVLGARSPVLANMFTHETRKITKRVVSIKDCRPDVFRSFVQYLYTGKVDDLSANNLRELFNVAIKYQVEELANDCVEYMIATVTTDTFFDAIELAWQHGKENLMDKAADVLSKNVWEIIETEKWKSFLEKNPLRANEMLQRACKRRKM